MPNREMDQRYIERLDYNASETWLRSRLFGQFVVFFLFGPDLKRNPDPNVVGRRSAWLENEFITKLFVDHCRQILLLDHKMDQQIAS